MNVPYTVEKTVLADLCCGCGVCSGICPRGCIAWEKKDGMYLPHIDGGKCVRCGLCAAVCPGLGHRYAAGATAEETVAGPVLAAYNAWSRDPELRHVSASGGVVSTILRELLASGAYDGAFCLDTYDYRAQLKTRLYTAEELDGAWSTSKLPKSRYLPVSQERAVAYMKENRDARLIFVGTSCAVRGLLAAVEQLKLRREKYLFLGLFCDQVFNYNVISYWQELYCDGRPLTELHFKNKESGGWPGDMKLFPEGQKAFYVPLAERARAKAYFVPERCLCCVDKLNACADLSLGDNYTGKDSSALGSNSVLLRTQAGAAAWNAAKKQLVFRDIEIGEVQRAQALGRRLENLYCGDLKTARMKEPPDLNPGVPREKNARAFTRVWKARMQRRKAGALYDRTAEPLKKQLKKDARTPNPVIRFARRAIGWVRRRIQ